MKKLIKRYKDNLSYLKTFNTKLFNDILHLEQNLIDNQRYHLEYKNNSYNIYDSTNNTLLIKKDSNFDASFKAHQIDNSIKQSISLIKTKQIDFKKSFDYGIDSYKFINKYINKIKFTNIKLKEYKFIFCGVILGIDINHIIKKSKATSYIFIEEDIELFRLSLFIVPYFKISRNTKLFFEIGENNHSNFDKFIQQNTRLNHFIKYAVANNSYKKLCTKLISQIELNNPLMYTFSEYLGSYKRGLKYINSFAKFLKFNNNLKNKHILYLGAGPSLEDKILFVKKNKNKFIIIALGATLKLLEKYNIKPDIIISIDGSTKIQTQFKDLDKSYLKNIPIILSLNTNKKVIKYLDKSSIYFIQTSNIFYDHIPNFTGNSAGEIGLAIILNLNPLDIYLLGFDLSITQNKTHISTHTNTILKNEINNLIPYEGNLQNTIFTINRFIQIKRNFEDILIHNKKDIYNLSDGIKINYTKSLKIKDITLTKCKKNIKLKNKKMKKVKKDKNILKQILYLYEELLNPYSTLLTSQEKYDKIKSKQIQTIKNYYEKIR